MKILRVVEHIQHDFLVFLSGAREKGSKGRILKGKMEYNRKYAEMYKYNSRNTRRKKLRKMIKL